MITRTVPLIPLMKITAKTILPLFLCAMPANAQEFSLWEHTTGESTSLKAGSLSPIDVSKDQSVKTLTWKNISMALSKGDCISKLSFHGYNMGKEQRRHLKVWMRNDDSLYERDINTDDVSKMTCVFDGDCTIPRGGKKETHIPLLEIPMNEPFLYTKLFWLVIKIECTGEAVEDSIFFEYDDSYRCPVGLITVQSPVVYYSGCVINQDYQPVAHARVKFYSDFYPDKLEYIAETNEQGNFIARIERGNIFYRYEVKSNSCAEYLDGIIGLTSGKDSANLNFVVYDAIRFKTDEPSSIILPREPDPTLGRYYRLDRWDGEKNGGFHYYFEREYTPRANVPYVIIPNNDFEIHPCDYDILDAKPEIIRAEHPNGSSVSFIGSYQNRIIHYGQQGEYVDFVYMTPDCSYLYNEWGRSYNEVRIGAFRACFHFYGTWGTPYRFVFDGEESFVSTPTKHTADNSISSLYDLQGRPVTSQPRRGVYICYGRKVVVKSYSE